MTRKESLNQLFIEGKLKEYLQELYSLTERDEAKFHQNTAILLMSRFNSLEREINQRIISDSNRELRTNQLRAAALSLTESLEKELPDVMSEELGGQTNSGTDSETSTFKE